jgi:flagellar biosynthesis/type III secretory pathway M-ring protein FliF/YscJ
MPNELSGPRVNSTKAQTNMGMLLQRVWPLAAVTLIAIFTAIWIRGRQKPASLNKQNVEHQASDESESQILQGHLASLIDRDPETAAKVIKNWIRQSS